MASAKAGVHVRQLKPVEVTEFLLRGDRFYKFGDDESYSTGCFVVLRVDPKGHVLYWANNSDATQCLDMNTILDVRWEKYAKLPKDFEAGREKLAGSFVIPAGHYDSCVLSIVSGCNTITELSFTYFVAPSHDVARRWGDAIFKIATNVFAINGSVFHFINRACTQIRYGCEQNTKVKDVVKLFANNKEERKIVEKAMQSAELPITREDCLNIDRLTDELFFSFYRHLTKRTDVQKIFSELQSPGGSVGGPKKSIAKSGEPTITTHQLIDFLNKEQRDPRLNEILYPYYNEKSAQRLIDQYEPSPEMAKKGLLTLDGFLRYLIGEDNGVLAEDAYDLRPEDLNEPLSHYFINSSHNTYLTGGQFNSRSSVEIYREVLILGCRSIELDCWDKGNEPCITHGPSQLTRVSQVPFKDVIEAIGESAFKTSSYPVILSFENHCNAENQQKMANYCKEILGDLLLQEPLPSYPLEQGIPLPSPEALKRKIIIKNKKVESTSQNPSRNASIRYKTGVPPMQPRASQDRFSLPPTAPTSELPPAPDGPLEIPESVSQNFIDPLGRSKSASRRTVPVRSTSSDSTSVAGGGEGAGPGGGGGGGGEMEEEEEEDEEVEEVKLVNPEIGEMLSHRAAKEATTEVGREISELVNYMRAMGRFKGFEECERRNMSSELYSLGETTALKHLATKPVQFVNHNKRQITRTYPKGTRVDSGNYLPQAFWNTGCQMVALNFQTLDLPMQLNLGLFEMNGRSGYLLKPECMRKRDRFFDPFETDTVENIVPNTVTIQIISGQLLSTLSDRRLGCSVEVEMYGISVDTVRQKEAFKTKIVQNNGINPVFNDRPFEFKKVIMPELATLRIAVNDENGKMVGHRILPVTSIRPGYRHVVLRNAANQPLGMATLFVKIGVKDYVPDAQVAVVDALVDPISAAKRYDYFANALVNPIAHFNEKQKHEEMLKSLIDDDPASRALKAVQDLPEQNGPTVPSSLALASHDSPTQTPPLDPKKKSRDESALPKLERDPSGVFGGEGSKGPSSIIGTLSGLAQSSSALKIPSLNRVSTNRDSRIDSYTLSVPSLSSLLAMKKISKLSTKQDRAFEALQAKHCKERDRLREKQRKKQTKMEHIHAESHNVFGNAAVKLSRSANSEGQKKLDPSQRQEELYESLTEETRRLRLEQEKEMRTLCTKQWKEAKNIKEEHRTQQKDACLECMDQQLKTSRKTLETLYTKEVEQLMKVSMEGRKSQVSEMVRQTTNVPKDELAKRKEKIEKKSIDATLEKRKSLMTAKTKKEEELIKDFDTLRDSVESSFSTDMAEIAAQYDPKIRNGELPDDEFSTKL